MEAARNLLSSPPTAFSRTQLKNSSFPSSSSSVSMFHEQAGPAATSIPITSVARNFPASVLLQEQRDDNRPQPVLQFFKEDKAYSEANDKQQIENGASLHEGKASNNVGHLELEQQLLHIPDLKQLLSLLESGEYPSSPLNIQSVAADTEEVVGVEPNNVIALAKKALSASKQAASLAENLNLDLDYSVSNSLGSANASTLPVEEEEGVIVRSTRRLERQSKRRRLPKVMDPESYSSRRTGVRRKSSEGFDPSDPLRLFLWGPETTQLLTAKEESELISQVQDLIRLKKVKTKLQSQFGREPTLVEWAEALGLTCSALQAELHHRYSSRDRLINANLRMVVHIAKQYQGRGVSLQDMLQEGSKGLMKSVEKFKPQVGCRFATYAYWWVRQSITKFIFQHSRTIRLPENAYNRLNKVFEAKKSFIQEGNHCPSKEEIARRVGITVDKLDRLLLTTLMPLSMQQPIWSDQNITFQEVTPDTGVEIPDVTVAKQLMRQHVRNLLNVLNPRERRIIKLRFGIGESKQNSLSEIGDVFGLTKERVRQIESRALHKLKQCLSKQGLGEGRLRKGMIDVALRQLAIMEKKGLQPDVFTYNIIATLIDIHCKEGNLVEAKRPFQQMEGGGLRPNNITYNAPIDGYTKKGEMKVAYKLRDEMEAKGIFPDVYTYTSLVHGIASSIQHPPGRLLLGGCKIGWVIFLSLLKLGSLVNPGIEPELCNNLMENLKSSILTSGSR
ncbi:RNA polymerase sigma-70 [Corchorus olitorius]|uniref:RNA polymerase sigma-70 n=1 Tax=Corchorus olitorius TaxID=93759 RepID=A0A1R3HTH0_9ROSI|nr:RNA polymerase sigma-70 [Corchorus olitorius]